MTILANHTVSHIEQLHAARLAEESERNAARLANWHARHHRDPVCVPEKADVVFVAMENVESIPTIRSVK